MGKTSRTHGLSEADRTAIILSAKLSLSADQEKKARGVLVGIYDREVKPSEKWFEEHPQDQSVRDFLVPSLLDMREEEQLVKGQFRSFLTVEQYQLLLDLQTKDPRRPLVEFILDKTCT